MLVTVASSFFIMAFALHRIGPDEFGLYVIITASTDLLALADVSLGLGILRAAARRDRLAGPSRAEAARDVQAGHSALMAISGAVLIVGAGLAMVVPSVVNVPGHRAAAVRAGLFLATAGASLGLATSSALALVNARREFRLLFLASATGMGLRMALVMSLAIPLRMVGLIIAQLGGIAVERAILTTWVRRRLSWFHLRPRHLSLRDARRMAGFALPMLVFSITIQAATSLQTLVVGSVAGPLAVALYRLGSSLPILAFGILAGVFSAALPSLASSAANPDQEDALRFLSRMLSFGGGLGFSLMAFLRHDLVTLLLGHDSELAANVLLVFSCALTLDAAVHGPAAVVIIRGHHARMASFSPLELALNLTLTVLLVHIMGPLGAGLAVLTTNVVTDLIIFPWIAAREFETRALGIVVTDGILPALAGAAIAAGSAGLLWQVPSPPMRFALIIILTTSAGLAAAVGGIGREGRRLLRSTFETAIP